jgi:hypothetical protein
MTMKVCKKAKLDAVGGGVVKKADGKEMNLGEVMITALLNPATSPVAGAKPDDGAARSAKWQLAWKIDHEAGDDVELTVTEVAKIKELIGASFPPVVVGPAWMILDPPDSGGCAGTVGHSCGDKPVE